MRFRMYRIALFVGWIVAALLAVAGFAAFSASNEPAGTPDVDIAPGLGRTAGAVSALSFTYHVDGEPVTSTSIDIDQAVQRALEARADRIEGSGDSRATTNTVIRSRYLSESQVRNLVAKYFRPADVNKAVRIAWCESTFNPNSVNPTSGASGLFQHLPEFWAERSAAAGFAGADIFDPDANVAVAAWLVYEAPGGWSHWTCNA